MDHQKMLFYNVKAKKRCMLIELKGEDNNTGEYPIGMALIIQKD